MKIFLFTVLFILSTFFSQTAFACDSCGCTLSKMSSHLKEADQSAPWFFDLTFEQQNWKIKNAGEAHTLHHRGREFHDKTHEEFTHFTAGVSPWERFILLGEIPYVVRGFLDIEHTPDAWPKAGI